MGLAVLAVLGGLVLLTLASDRFVMGTARIALALRISPVVVGAVIIGFGTSAPELLISGLAAGQGLVGIAVGNIVGSNIANLTLVLGTAALIFPLRATSRTLRRELPLSCLAVFAFALAAQGSLKPVEGVVLLATIVAVLWWLVSSARRDRRLTEEVEEFVGETPSRISLPRESLRTLLGLAGTLAGAQLLVTGARDVAEALGVSDAVIGLTVVALGTSLPELFTAIQAARRHEDELIVGNLLGSNLFNSLAVGGVAASASGGAPAGAGVDAVAILLMVGVAGAAWGLMARNGRVERWEGGLLVGVYFAGLAVIAI